MPRPRLLLTALMSLTLVAAATGLLRHYHIGVSNDSDVAEWAAATGRGPEECLRIIPIDIFPRPTAEQIRSSCVRRYAEITHDPSACELLMPSTYGLSCVGAAENHHLPCGTSNLTVHWQEQDIWHQAHLTVCAQNSKTRSEVGNQCCQAALVRYLKGKDDCGFAVANGPIHDRCLYNLAWKKNDESYCADIQNENAKAACIVQSKALRQNPSICPGCIPPVESVEDLR